jgi:20S proteasome subunit beta 3
MDLIGCMNMPEDFVLGGTCSEQLYGMCESLWEPELGPDDLFETISQALVNACDRDAISGWGAKVFIM